jgi:hypothetical protein
LPTNVKLVLLSSEPSVMFTALVVSVCLIKNVMSGPYAAVVRLVSV